MCFCSYQLSIDQVRPLLPKEKVGGEDMCVRILPATNQLILGKDRAFTFDDVLAPKTSQDDAYKLCVENLVKSIFDGYNATVFAYGQTVSLYLRLYSFSICQQIL